MQRWGTSASFQPLGLDVNLSAHDYFPPESTPIVFENEQNSETLCLHADWINSPSVTATSPVPIIEPALSPICDQVDVTIAIFDHLPEEVSVAVDTQLLNDIEVTALLEDPQNADYSDVSEYTSNASERSDNDFPVDTDLMLALRRWNVKVHNSRDAMANLLFILREAGHTDLPLDWRTVLHRCEVVDAIMANDNHDASERTSLKQHFDSLTLVCGACWLAPFDNDQLEAAFTCSTCGVATVRCSRSDCDERCVLTTTLGKRSVDTLKPCSVCLISSTSFTTHRSYHFSLSSYIRDAFADESRCLKFLFPFRGHFECVDHSGNRDVVFKPSWLIDWLNSVRTSTVSTQLFHGDRFNQNPVWKEHGPRSLVILLSIDWFPPFKSRDYTIGVLTATVANLSTTDRAELRNTWILTILEGPKEPSHLFYCVATAFLEMRALELQGLRVFDALTEEWQDIYISVGLVSADTPAAAKLGDHAGHGGYQPCISCKYMGTICGCKSKDGEGIPPCWENFNYVSGMRKTQNGLILRKKRKGEHICFIDDQLLTRQHLRSDAAHRAGQLLMAKNTFTPLTTKAAVDRLRRTTKSNGLSALCILSSGDHIFPFNYYLHHVQIFLFHRTTGRFSFVEDFVIDAMHTLIKGPVSKQWRLTVTDQFKQHPWNVNYHKGHATKLRERLASFNFPVGHTNPNKFLDRPSCLKADELFVLARVCGWLLFDGLIPRGAVRAWFLLCRLTTALLHTHVLKQWMHDPRGVTCLVSEYYKEYLSVYGRCHMPSNFHRLLHLNVDFENWGPLRSHWCFPMERMYGALMIGCGRQNRSHVTQAIVNAVRTLYINGGPTDARTCATQRDVPEMVDVSDCALSTYVATAFRWVKSFRDPLGNLWRGGDLICVLPAGKSVTTNDIYVVAGLLQKNVATQATSANDTSSDIMVLRHITLEVQVLVRGLSATGFVLPNNWKSCLGDQVLLPVHQSTFEDVHICPVSTYKMRSNPQFVVPFCGYVDYSMASHNNASSNMASSNQTNDGNSDDMDDDD